MSGGVAVNKSQDEEIGENYRRWRNDLCGCVGQIVDDPEQIVQDAYVKNLAHVCQLRS